MTADNALGAFDFVRLTAPGMRADAVETVYEHSQIQQRPGIDSTTFIKTGLKGDAFQLESFVDVDTFADAQALKVTYKGACGNELYDIVCGGSSYYTVTGHKYFVLDVQARAVRIASSVGGLTSGGTGGVYALWTLVPVFLGIPDPGP